LPEDPSLSLPAPALSDAAIVEIGKIAARPAPTRALPIPRSRRWKPPARWSKRETMRLILIRHGKPDETDVDTPRDPPLDAAGWRQARSTARLLASEGVTRIVASPLRRARQTAEPLAERLGLAVETVDGWAEADRAAHRYRSLETLRAEGGDAWRRFLDDPIGSLGAEPGAFRAAVLAALHATAPRPDSRERVAIFTHGLPINLVLAHALGLESIVTFLVGYGSVTRLRLKDDGRFGVASVNETAQHQITDNEGVG